MPRYALLPDNIRQALERIPPSKADYLDYFPCRVTLINGAALDSVYIQPEKPFLRQWGFSPETTVFIEDVVKVEDSPSRLPVQFANEIYRGGESGNGYTIFTVIFSDGERQICAAGGPVDFIRYPKGKGPIDVVAVCPHEGRNTPPVWAPQWFWCFYSERD